MKVPPGAATRLECLLGLLLISTLAARAQQPPNSGAGQQPAAPAIPQAIETEKVQPSSAHPAPATSSVEPGFMEPAEVKALLHKIWLAEFRASDLLAQVQPERWNLGDPARDSVSKTLEALRGELDALEKWRDQFENRTDSMYLGYETYAALGAVLPRLEGLARGVSEHENASLGAQYSEAGNQLFDLQQSLRPYLGYLLRNQDQVLLATQNNLAACQNQLGYAMRGRAGPAKPIGNTMTGRPTTRRPSRSRSK